MRYQGVVRSTRSSSRNVGFEQSRLIAECAIRMAVIATSEGTNVTTLGQVVRYAKREVGRLGVGDEVGVSNRHAKAVLRECSHLRLLNGGGSAERHEIVNRLAFMQETTRKVLALEGKILGAQVLGLRR